ncbi:MAG: tRNA (guanosine(46)-N7)-methyltransferase TrmB [Chloroflexi bacterium]|nr:MAG: tRNA (guanosine(46)-N7)-methyltransferase TrmB [Chloroflexota bacterium]
MSSLMLLSTRMDWPTDWTAVFQCQAPLIMEIGFGGADFLVDLAQKRQDAHVVGIELSLPSLRKAEKKVRDAGLENVRIVAGDAVLVLWALCQTDSLAEVYINFPDPWPKERHHNRRLLSDDFLHLLATRMSPGAVIDIATDHADYAAWIAERLERTSYFHSRLCSTYVNEDAERIISKYEQKGFDEGRIGHYFKWQRNDTPAPNNYPVPKENAMPHVIVNSPMSQDDIAAAFTPVKFSQDDVHVSIAELFQSKYDGKLLLETYVKERPLSQRLGLLIRQREKGDYVVKMHEVGFPRPTIGIQIAIAYLATWLVGLHPQNEFVRSSLDEAYLQIKD